MAGHNITAYAAVKEDLNLPTRNNSVFPFESAADIRVARLCLAEEPGDYVPRAVDDAGFSEALKRIKLRASYRSADAQIGRLLRLANVLDSPSAADRPAEVLVNYAAEIRQTASTLEEILQVIVDPFLNEDNE